MWWREAKFHLGMNCPLQTARTNGLVMLAHSLALPKAGSQRVSIRLLLQTFWHRALLGATSSRLCCMSKLGHILRLIAADRAEKNVSCVTPQSEKKRLQSKKKKRERWGGCEGRLGGALSEGNSLPDASIKDQAGEAARVARP